MEFPGGLKYTKEHEWIRVEGDVGVVGVTDYAQDALGDIVFVELPNVGDQVEKDKSAGVVESVKSVSDIFAPVTGKVTEVNEQVSSNPELINKSPYNEGWVFKLNIRDKSELDDLMNTEDYQKLIAEKS